jgi:hypothetical protein|eukprot:2311499-Prymnesium_polylepis.1
MLVGRGSEGATGRAKEPRRVKHFCSRKQILVESAATAWGTYEESPDANYFTAALRYVIYDASSGY